jgi:hypothetical protein
MKTKLTLIKWAALLVLISTLSFQLSTVFAQGTAFTYQGRLSNSNGPANGTYDLTFALCNASSGGGSQIGSAITGTGIGISNGLFTIALDFGANFPGADRWLEISVRTNGGGSFTTLSPRQKLTPAPYAITAGSLNGTLPLAQLPGTVLTNNESGVTLTNLTLNGALTLPATAAGPDIIYSGSTLLLYGDNNGNFFSGQSSGNLTTSGSFNTAVGSDALFGNTSGVANTAIGYEALGDNTSGTGNTANGYRALLSNTNGAFNTAIGSAALEDNTSGSDNTAMGTSALFNNTSGSFNTAIGYQTLENNTNGADNTANGYEALLHNTSGSENTAFGYQTLEDNTSGIENTANGKTALLSNTSGTGNTANGYEALLNNTIGNNNIALGLDAGANLTTGSGNIDIGHAGVAGENNTIRIGFQGGQTTTFIAGISGATAASGVAVFVNSSGQLGTLTSSRRFKDDIQGMDRASDVLYALKPVTFKYKPGLDPQGIPQFGLVAEDVEKVAPDLVAHDDQGKIYTVRYQAVDAMLLNEFLKEHQKVEEQNVEIETLKAKTAKMDSLEKRLNELEQMVQSLGANK